MPTNTSTGNQRKARHYHTKIAGPHSHAQNIQVLNALRDMRQPTPIRMLHKAMNGKGYQIDLVSLRRAITNLSRPCPKGRWLNQFGKAMIRTAYEQPCPITKVTVGWYEVIPYKPEQTKLF